MSELQRLLDRLAAAGAPGAAGWVRNERGSLGAASGLANRRQRRQEHWTPVRRIPVARSPVRAPPK